MTFKFFLVKNIIDTLCKNVEWKVMSEMNVKEIVSEYLKKEIYDGLYSEYLNCSCDLDDLMPCDCDEIPSCLPGYKNKCDCGDDCLYHIGPLPEKTIKRN
jgi:hypothetical protein